MGRVTVRIRSEHLEIVRAEARGLSKVVREAVDDYLRRRA